MTVAKKLKLLNACTDNKAPRVGGGALIGNIVDWPIAPDGVPLTLVMSASASFLNEYAGLGLPQDLFVSVFSYYSKTEYFLDSISYHGSEEELDWLRKGYTRVIIHAPGGEVFGPCVIPAVVIEIGDEELDPAIPFGGSKIGGEPTLLQAEALALADEQFTLQLYGGNFPRPYQGIFGLSDAIGYLYIGHSRWKSKPADGGTFFVQAT